VFDTNGARAMRFVSIAVILYGTALRESLFSMMGMSLFTFPHRSLFIRGTIMGWPSTPDESEQAPTLLNLLATHEPEAAQAGYLVIAAATLKQKNCEVATQVVLRSDQHGAFTVPALSMSADTGFVIFTHWGPGTTTPTSGSCIGLNAFGPARKSPWRRSS
jgi:hypothetical protein